MLAYIIKRIFNAVLVLWVVITITFGLMHAIPGGPFTVEKSLPPVVLKSIEERYKLNDPLYKQYGDYLTNLVQGDLGPSFKYPGRSVNDIIKDGFPVSFQLGMEAVLIAVIIGIPAGVLAAVKQGKWQDHAVNFCTTLGVAVPSFVVAALLIYEYPDSAMAIVEKVEPRLAEDAAGNVLPGCLYASMASLFEYGFDYAKAVQYYEKGAKYFIRSKDYRNFTDMCIKAARCCYHMGEEDRAETFIDKVEPYKRYVEESNKVRYFRLILNMKHDIPIGDVMEAAAALGQERGSSTEPGNLLAIADIYLGLVDKIHDGTRINIS